MYVKELRELSEFLGLVRKYQVPVQVGERALALPVREQQGVVVRPALERHYVMNVTDDRQDAVRLIFTEHLVEHDGKFPFNDSLLSQLQSAGCKVVLTGRISGAA